jgi:membrane protein YdbS with pleckstrin-like domain
MKCSICGAAVSADAAYCSKCGAKVTATDDFDEDEPVVAASKRAPTPAGLQERGQTRGRSQPAETELWSGTYSRKAMVGPAIGCTIVSVITVCLVAAFANSGTGWSALGIGLLLLWAGLGLTLLYRRLTVRYRLTTFRFFHDTGLFSRTGNRIEVIDVDDVTVHQGLIERLFGVGTIRIASSDRTDPELRLPGIDDVRRVADMIDSARRAERHRRGLHIESI